MDSSPTGHVSEFVMVDDTVRRPATGSSAWVRWLLVHLEESGFGGAPRYLGTEPDGSMVLSWVEGWAPADAECWRLGTGELASVGELLGSYHDCVAGFAPGSGFAEGQQAVGSGQVVCHGDIAARNTGFAGGRAAAFIDGDGIFVAPRCGTSRTPCGSSRRCAAMPIGCWRAGPARLIARRA